MQVAVVPGSAFHPCGSQAGFKCPFVRLAFCNVNGDDAQEGIRRVGMALRKLADSDAPT